MPAPTTCEEFLGVLRKSKLVDEARLDEFLADHDTTEAPQDLAAGMLQAGLITRFQANQLMDGKSRGFRLGPYRVLEKLGSGATGTVFLCEHEVMRRRVAVKVLARVMAEDPVVLERFFREGRAAAALDHPNIVRAHDVGHTDNLYYIVMDYVEGSDIYNIVTKFGPMDVYRVTHYARQIADGLHFAHQAGFIHRDVKPSNLLLDREGHVKILDLGLARMTGDGGPEGDVLTQGCILGSEDYLAPEQAVDSHDVDARADIYGLGATMYFMLTGIPPFANVTPVARKLIAKQSQDPQPIGELRPEVPPPLAAVVARMMSRDPSKRYQSAHFVSEALGRWTATPIGPPPAREMPEVIPVAGGPKSAPRHPVAVPAGGPKSTARHAAVPAVPKSSAKHSVPVGAASKPKVGDSKPAHPPVEPPPKSVVTEAWGYLDPKSDDKPAREKDAQEQPSIASKTVLLCVAVALITSLVSWMVLGR